MKIGIVAGEESGDQLGAGLIAALRRKVQSEFADSHDARGLIFTGVGGERMQAEGFNSIADMELLSVMGLVEPIKRLPALIGLRRRLIQYFLGEQIDLFIGIDSPDFNLGLAKKLKRNGITTCHYVCPSVWAWRQGRVKTIRESVDHVLALLPFEKDFLSDANIAATFVGHPVADSFLKQDKLRNCTGSKEDTAVADAAREALTICVMPGSRHSELDRLLPVFLKSMLSIHRLMPHVRFVLPAANDNIARRIELALEVPEYSIVSTLTTLMQGNAHNVMHSADLVLLASGTAALEAGLLAKPMVVTYKLNPLTYSMAKRLVKVEHISLPNLLLRDQVVPELIQDQANPRVISAMVCELLQDVEKRKQMSSRLSSLLPMLAQNADETAAQAVLSLLR